MLHHECGSICPRTTGVKSEHALQSPMNCATTTLDALVLEANELNKIFPVYNSFTGKRGAPPFKTVITSFTAVSHILSMASSVLYAVHGVAITLSS